MAGRSRYVAGVRSILQRLESRLFLSSTPFTADGRPWEVLASGVSWVEAENFDYGGQGVAYSNNNSNNPGGAYRTGEKVGIEGPSTNAGNTYNTGYFNAGNWLKYTITVDQAGTYVIDLKASTASAGATGHITFDTGTGTPVSTGAITIANIGGWGVYGDCTATVTLAAGQQVMTVYDDASQYNIDYVSFTPQAGAGVAEKSYNPTNPGNAAPVFRNLPALLPAFGGTQIESEYFDMGGEAAGGTGVQSAGYYWPTPSTAYATYPYTANPFRAADTVNTSDSGSGIVTTNWLGGNWTQYRMALP